MTRSFQVSGAPHVPAQVTVAKVMLQVLLALVPGVLAYAWFFGAGILVQILLSCVFALSIEALMLRLRGRALKPFINDYSAVVTAVLFALCIPPLAPWWISCIAMLFGIGFAKHLYGGLGQNVFNPAMVAY
ncbi:MAG: RnfABCDGE type electron transport complex subunit D, partial [Lysobacterales bacterium]